MLQRRTALAVILALSLVLAACGGSSEDSTDDASSAASTSTQAISYAPLAEPTPAPAAPVTLQVEATPAESASAEGAAPESASAPTAGLSDPTEHIRQRMAHLWEVYNLYDGEALKALYEENYWAEREEQVLYDLANFEKFELEITPEELTPPTETAPGKWETAHRGYFLGGSVDVVFVFEKFDGEWLPTHAE